MSLRRKILLVFAGGLFAGFGLFGLLVSDLLRQSYRQNVEEMMVDVSQLLATGIELEANSGPGVSGRDRLVRLFDAYKARKFTAQIFDLTKSAPGLDVYVTDAKGIVLYSSENRADAGRDFSRWRDVRLTLDGRYGSRSTRRDPKDPGSSVFYVAAPIHDEAGRIIGCLSIIKHRTSVVGIVESALRKMLWLGLLVIGLMLIMGGLLFQWVTLPLGRLETYARSISAGRQTPLPPLRSREIVELGRAFEEMRVAVEGKKEVERMAQSLSHELKSPLSAIQGAAELLQEPAMDPVRRERFLANIVGESQRAKEIVERLLDVTALETRSTLERTGRVVLDEIIEAAVAGLLGLYSARDIRVSFKPSRSEVAIRGDAFLLQQCIRNLLQNAVEFSPAGAEVRVWIEQTLDSIRIAVEDDGTGIPVFARDRLFEKFFSLERPSTGRKGSGLGLSFVSEVMTLHGGRVHLDSPITSRGGTRACLEFPM